MISDRKRTMLVSHQHPSKQFRWVQNSKPSLNDRKIKTKNRKYDEKYCGKFFESVAGATSGDEEYA